MLRSDGVVRNEDGSISTTTTTPAPLEGKGLDGSTAASTQSGQTSAGSGAALQNGAVESIAQKIAVAQALLTEARQGVKQQGTMGSNGGASLPSGQGSEADVAALLREAEDQLASQQAAGSSSQAAAKKTRGDLAYDFVDAAQLAAIAAAPGLRRTIANNAGDGGLLGTSFLRAQAGALPSAAQAALLETQRLAGTAGRTFQDTAREKWTPEMRARLLLRARKLAADLQRNEEYRTSVIYFVDLVERILPIKQLLYDDDEAEPKDKKGSKESSIEKAKRRLNAALGDTAEPILAFLDHFAEDRGAPSLRSVLVTASELAEDTFGEADPNATPEAVAAKPDNRTSARTFWRMADKFLRDMLLLENYALSPQCETDARAIRAAYLQLSKDYREKVARVVAGFSTFLSAFSRDAILHDIAVHFKDFTKSLVLTRNGAGYGLPSKAIWHDLRLVVLPYLFDRIGVLPIPRVRYLHPDFEVAVENVALQLRQLLPNTFDLNLKNDFHVDFRNVKADSTHMHRIKIKFKGMGIRVHKLAYAFRWKKGVSFLDKGIGDLNIDGFGLSIYLDIPKDTSKHFFLVRKVNAKLSTLSLKVRQSNHRILHGVANTLVNSFLTKTILRKFIAYGVKLGLQQADLAIQQARLNEAVEEDRMTLEEIKRQMAALRDLLRKYHEQAGELQIDFSKEDDPNNEKRWEDAHAIKWVQGQLDRTARREIIRDEWRSNAFDMPGMDSIKPPSEEKKRAQREAEAKKAQQKQASKDEQQRKKQAEEERIAKEAHKDAVAGKADGKAVAEASTILPAGGTAGAEDVEKAAAAVVDGSRAEETPAEAAAQGKPMVTDQSLVEDVAKSVEPGTQPKANGSAH